MSAEQADKKGRFKERAFVVMSELTKVCATSDVAEGSVKSFEIGNNVIAIYNVGGEFFATDNECTHGAASLAEGILEDDIIECTLHFGAFNVKTEIGRAHV